MSQRSPGPPPLQASSSRWSRQLYLLLATAAPALSLPTSGALLAQTAGDGWSTTTRPSTATAPARAATSSTPAKRRATPPVKQLPPDAMRAKAPGVAPTGDDTTSPLPSFAPLQAFTGARDATPTTSAIETSSIEKAQAGPPSPPAPPAPPVATAPATAESATYKGAVQQFCSNIGPTAIEARVAWQQKILADIEKDIEQRIAKLDARVAEHKEWLAKRQEFAAKAGKSLGQVVARMRPEAAAQQLAVMDEEISAALLMGLEPKVAAPLLNEMPPAKAARLSSLIAAAAAVGPKGSESGATSPASVPAPAPSQSPPAPSPPATAAPEGAR